MVCIHETAATSAIWDPLAAALEGRARTIAFDRRGCGRSPVPETYGRTTVEEQAEDAATVIAAADAAPATLCGAGLGAIAALDLLVRRSALASAGVLIEPPLLALLPEATEGISEDGEAIREAVQEGGPVAGLDLYLSGALGALGPGAERLPAEVASVARERPLTLFAELGAVSAWALPLEAMRRLTAPTRIVVCASTPPLVRAASAALATRLAGSAVLELEVDGHPHASAPAEIAEIVTGLLPG